MLQEYAIGRCSRKCQRGNRDLKPGETFYSVILDKGGDLVREDIAQENWTEPPHSAIGWWKQRMPSQGIRKLRPAPVGVLLETLSGLIDRPGKESLAYLLALLLVRRRVLTEVDSLDSVYRQANDENQVPGVWHLTLAADGRQWNVPVAIPQAHMTEALQQELTSLLFTEE